MIDTEGIPACALPMKTVSFQQVHSLNCAGMPSQVRRNPLVPIRTDIHNPGGATPRGRPVCMQNVFSGEKAPIPLAGGAIQGVNGFQEREHLVYDLFVIVIPKNDMVGTVKPYHRFL